MAPQTPRQIRPRRLRINSILPLRRGAVEEIGIIKLQLVQLAGFREDRADGEVVGVAVDGNDGAGDDGGGVQGGFVA